MIIVGDFNHILFVIDVFPSSPYRLFFNMAACWPRLTRIKGQVNLEALIHDACSSLEWCFLSKFRSCRMATFWTLLIFFNFTFLLSPLFYFASVGWYATWVIRIHSRVHLSLTKFYEYSLKLSSSQYFIGRRWLARNVITKAWLRHNFNLLHN